MNEDKLDVIIYNLQCNIPNSKLEFMEYFFPEVEERIWRLRGKLIKSTWLNEQDEMRSVCYLRLVEIANEIIAGTRESTGDFYSYVSTQIYFTICHSLGNAILQNTMSAKHCTKLRGQNKGHLVRKTFVSTDMLTLKRRPNNQILYHQTLQDLLVGTEGTEEEFLIDYLCRGYTIQDISKLLGKSLKSTYRISSKTKKRCLEIIDA